ncbi:endo-1,4-beta-xylanase [Marinobacter lacisalsi]|uniref:Endo-1,4-beta-xylanase n=1 Tax=Marinobacter lacisalsi TaxID=475979 RepID=A0ABV8QCF1_9GAMM
MLNRATLNPASLFKALVLVSTCLVTAGPAVASNPIVTHAYTADPAARVMNGRVYVVTTHDQPGQTDYSQLVDYRLFSSDDMENWQDHGIIWNSREDSSWANLAYAPDIIERNGKYYLYFPDGGSTIGVAVADRPEGPYRDPIGGPLVHRSIPNANVEWVFDPGVFIDDDGQAYLYFGGGGPGNARVIRLNDDMISTRGSAITLDVPYFFEALHMHKRNGTYYLSYSTNSQNGIRIDYMTSNSPVSGFTHRGTILPNPWENNNNNNHQSIVEFDNDWYLFYHNRALSNAQGGTTYMRSINVDRLTYNSNGLIPQVDAGPGGVSAISTVDAFAVNQAERFSEQSNINIEPASEGTQNLMMPGQSWVKVSNVDFGNGASGFQARVAGEVQSGIQVILDDINNPPVATLQTTSTGGWQTWETQTVNFNQVTGVHDVYLRSIGYHNLNWFRFVAGESDGQPGQPADPNRKFLGNIVDAGNANFTRYWNQVTPENSGKWESVEPRRDGYSWSKMDEAYNFAKSGNMPFKHHTFVWGSQEPNWLGSLSNADRAAEVEELIRDTCRRYPDMEMIDVVNEPIHAPSNARWGLGGDGATGWDWIVRSFELARQYCPNSKLLLNEYGIINDRAKATRYRQIVEILNDRGLIDGMGLQSHSFNLVGYDAATLKGNLDFLAQAGVPIYISEWDIDGSDQMQLNEFRQKFPVVWEHPAVAGVTLWGYMVGRTWMDNSGLMYADGTERPALAWLREYTEQNTDTPPPPTSGSGDILVRARGTQGDEQIRLIVSGESVAQWTLSTGYRDYTYSVDAEGDILVEFVNDADGRDVQVDYLQVNNETRQAEDMSHNTGAWDGECGGGTLSEWLHCNGSVGFGTTYDCYSGSCSGTSEPVTQPGSTLRDRWAAIRDRWRF